MNKSNKKSSKVLNSKFFLTKHCSSDLIKTSAPMKKHSVETVRPPTLGLTRSVEARRKLEYPRETFVLYSPQEIPSHVKDSNSPFTRVEKDKRFWLRLCHKVETQPATFKQLSIDPQKEIDEYAKNEWMTTLPNALKMKEGYRRVKEEGYGHIRRIRGDNYCALRSVMFQTLTSCDVKKSILTRFSEETALKRLEELRGEYGGLIDEWKFGTNSFLREGNGNSRYKSLQACIKTFYDMVRKLGGKPPRERRDLLVTEMNKEEVHRFATDAKLVECIKFFMFSYAEKLYKKLATGKDVPLWFTLLTLRGNSSSLQEYFQEQLNNVGDSLGLEQVEMCLLSTSLNAKIKVFRLSSVDKDDFQTRYPSEESAEGTQLQEIVLCAEDDRHYNVVYKL